MTKQWPMTRTSNGTKLGLIPEDIYVNLVGRPVSKSISQIIMDQQRESTKYMYPDGQRDPTEAWTTRERAEYIDSLCKNMCADQNWLVNHVSCGSNKGYWLLDAGHRFETVRMYIADELRDLEGNLFSQYTEDQRNYFLDLTITICIYRDLTGEQQQLLFTRRNKGAVLKGGEWLNSKLMSSEYVFVNRLYTLSFFRDFKDDATMVKNFENNSRFCHMVLIYHLASNYLLTRFFVDHKDSRNVKDVIIMKSSLSTLEKENSKIERVIAKLTSSEQRKFFDDLKNHITMLFKLWKQHRTQTTPAIIQKDLFHVQYFILNGTFQGYEMDKLYAFMRDIQDRNSKWSEMWINTHKNKHGNTGDDVINSEKRKVFEEYMSKHARGTKRPRKQSAPTRCTGVSFSLQDRVTSVLSPRRVR